MKNSNTKYLLLVVFLLLPLFFINVKNTHDWGDDFAQYLIQARNIVEDRPQTYNGLLLNEKERAYAIEAYPVGFPLMIAPLYYFFQLSIQPYCMINSFLLFAAGILMFEFFRKRIDVIPAILITLLFCYNVNTLDLKKQILSEIAFTCTILVLIFYRELKIYNKKYSWVLTGSILASLVSIRLAGVAFLTGFILFELYTILQEKERIVRIQLGRKLLLSFSSFFIFFFLLNELIFPIKTGGLFHFYTNALHQNSFQFSENLKFYYTVSEYFFPLFGEWIPSLWILLALSGWFIRLIKSPTLCEIVFPIYILLVLFYPYAHAGLRFLIPVFPLLIFYTYDLSSRFFYRIKLKRHLLPSFILLPPLIASFGPLMGIIKIQNSIEEGPEQPAAVELFNFLKTTPTESAIVFCKARAMSLYSKRYAMYTAKDKSPDETYIQFHRYSPLYLVTGKVLPGNEIYDPVLNEYLSRFKLNYEIVWENEGFKVYKQK
jgi:hypothetical protein